MKENPNRLWLRFLQNPNQTSVLPPPGLMGVMFSATIKWEFLKDYINQQKKLFSQNLKASAGTCVGSGLGRVSADLVMVEYCN